MLLSAARNLGVTARSQGKGSQAPACAVRLSEGESCSSRTHGQTSPEGRLARARRRRLPCAQSRAPSSSAPHGRLMVPRQPPALPAGRGSRRRPRDERQRETAEGPRRGSVPVHGGGRALLVAPRPLLPPVLPEPKPPRQGTGRGCPGPGCPAPRAAAPATATAPGPAPSAGPAPSRPRPPPLGP